jgi:hypothetical protein
VKIFDSQPAIHSMLNPIHTQFQLKPNDTSKFRLKATFPLSAGLEPTQLVSYQLSWTSKKTNFRLDNEEIESLSRLPSLSAQKEARKKINF